MPNFDFFKAAAEKAQKTTHPKPPGWKGRQDALNPVALRQQDFNGYVDVPGKDGKIVKRKMTQKQKLTAEYILKGYSRRQAMLKAGYPLKFTNKFNTPTYNKTVMSFVETMEDKLTKKGLTKDYLADKFSEWIDAKRVVVGKDGEETVLDDYDTQIKAYDRMEKIMNPSNKGKEEGGKKREVTFTEWVNGGTTAEEVIDEEA